MLNKFNLLRPKKRARIKASEQRADPSPSETFMENIFDTYFSRNALLSYIIAPFRGDAGNHHSQNQEAVAIAEILKESGFNVDVINWNNETFIPSKKYDIVIDNHNNLARLQTYFKDNTIKIFHATNAFWLYQNHIEWKAAIDYFFRKGISLKPNRIVNKGNSALCADYITMFGNEFTQKSYGALAEKVYPIPMSVTATIEGKLDKDFLAARYNFIWLNSHGALLKGLDILVDAFEQLPKCHLYVFGNNDRDKEFWTSVERDKQGTSNIHLMGWADINSNAFVEVARNCAWVISTSRSEGGGGSILNCMAKGVIPIISRSSSISLPEKTGYYIEPNEPEELITLVKKIVSENATSLKEQSANAVAFIRETHTLPHFKNAYLKFLKETLNKHCPTR